MKHRDSRHDTTQATRIRFLVRMLGMLGLMGIVVGFILYVPGSSQGAKAASVGFMAIGGLMAIGWVIYELKNVVTGMASQKAATGSASALQVVLALLLLLLVNVISFKYYHRQDVTRDQRFTIAPELREKLKQLSSKTPTTIVVLLRNKTSSIESDDPRALETAAQLKIVEKVRDLIDEIRELGPQFNVHVLQTTEDDFDNKLESLTPLIDLKKIAKDDHEAREAAMKANRTSRKYRDAMLNAPENSIFFFANNKMQRLGFNQFYMLDKSESLAKSTGILNPRLESRESQATASLTNLVGHPITPGSIIDLSWADGQRRNITVVSVTGDKAEIEGGSGDDLPMNSTSVSISTPSERNLVLTPQGKERFVERLLKLEERSPRIGLLTIHPYLTSREADEDGGMFTASGMRRVLEMNGFEVVDIVLKKGWDGESPLSPSADSYEVSKLDEIEPELVTALETEATAQQQLKQFELIKKRVESGKIEDVDRIFRRVVGRQVVESDRELIMKRVIIPNMDQWAVELADARKTIAEVTPQYQKFINDDRVMGDRASNDVKPKLRSQIKDCDLLMIPKLTTVNLVNSFIITPSLFNLSKDQTDAVRDYMASGKPVYFGFGPNIGGRTRPGEDAAGDELDGMIRRLGIDLGNQAILTSVEAKAMGSQRRGPGGPRVNLPPLVLNAEGKTHPITKSLGIANHSIDGKLEIKRSGYRWVRLEKAVADRLGVGSEILFTTADAWNEDRPMPERGGRYTPKFDPPKADDPRRGTRDEEHKESFPVGVAAELPIPVEWNDPKSAAITNLVALQFGSSSVGSLPALGTIAMTPNDLQTTKTTRVMVTGHGGFFNGTKLDAGQETLLLSSVHWLLNHDDRLAKDAKPSEQWHYPRLHLQPVQYSIWRWGTFLGLPMLAGFVGIVVLMLRQLR